MSTPERSSKGGRQRGDLTNENWPTYTWNAEQQLTAAAGVTYTYDGDGLRVKKSNGKMYWRSTAISVLAETDLAGNNPVEFIYFAGQRVALRDASGAVFFIYSDHLGSARVITDATGTVCRDVDYFPYGGEKITLNTCALLSYNFATYERDPESGLDYAIFRYYNSRLGRFMSPDLLAGSTSDAQSLNKYSYVRGDPINRIDPRGLVPLWLQLIDGGGYWPRTSPGGGMGGGGFGCGIDGISVYCGAALAVLSSGAGARCPDDTCTVVYETQVFHFHAFANGGVGFYSDVGPGSLHYTREGASIAAANFAKGMAHAKDWEYGGLLYRDANGMWSYTRPVTNYSPFYVEPRGVLAQSLTYMGTYHTHVSLIPELEEIFSPTDIAGSDDDARSYKYPLWFALGTPGGRVVVYFTSGTPGSICDSVVISGPPLPPGYAGCN